MGAPFCCFERREFSINTVHLSPSVQGLFDLNAMLLNSFSTDISSFSACSSRKDPVPAAQALFISKSTIIPSLIEIYFESCPPISNIVSTSGSILTAASAWAVISFFTISAPTKSAIIYLPEPVVPTPQISTLSAISLPTSSSPLFTASIGLPAVIRYLFESTLSSSSITARFVLIEPMSIPRYAFTFSADSGLWM